MKAFVSSVPAITKPAASAVAASALNQPTWLRALLGACLGVALVQPLVAVSATPVAGLQARIADGIVWEKLPALSDRILRSQVGRYSGQPLISGALFELSSQWQLANGLQLGGTAGIAFDLSGAQPKVSVFTQTSSVAGQSALPSRASGISAPTATAQMGKTALEGVNGVAQSVQVAGDTNRVLNGLQIDVIASSNANAPQPLAGAQQNLSQSNGPGYQVRSGVNNQGLSLSLSVNELGAVKQSISAGGSTLAPGVHQSVSLLSSANIVLNRANLTLYTAPLAGVPVTEAVKSSLAALKGL